MNLKPKADLTMAPDRWVSRPAGGCEAEDRLAALIRATEPPRELSAASRARAWSRFRQTSRPRRPPARLRWGVALAVLLTSGVVIGAVSARRWWPPAPTAGTAMPDPMPAKARARAARHPIARPGQPTASPDEPAAPGALPIAAALPEAEPIPEPMPPPSSPRTAAPPSRVHHVEAPRAAASRDLAPASRDGSGPSALSGETPLLSEALTRLRQKRDARGALATLDVYRALYPEGMLKHEADGARVDALLMLGRDDGALSELRTLTLQAQGRDIELRLVRGELSAAADCARAIADFDRVLAERAPQPFAERALHGRAACRARLGDEAGARRDLAEYLRRFPEGRFASEARRRTGGDAEK